MLIGHKKNWQNFEKLIKEDKLAHAYLFFGEEKLGKKTFALELAKLINNNKGGLKRDYANLILVEPEKEEGEVGDGVIQISQIRELSRKLALKSDSNLFKIAIIDQAHLMTQEAQSAILKILEEPRGKTVFILITEFLGAILPTIISRVQRISFFSIKEETEIQEYLIHHKGVSVDEAKEISQVSYNKPGVAIDLASYPEKLKNQKKIIKDLITISAPETSVSFRFQYIKNLIESESNIKEILDLWLRFFRQRLILEVSNNSDFNKTFKIKNIIQKIQNTYFLISTTNANIKLALEVLILEL